MRTMLAAGVAAVLSLMACAVSASAASLTYVKDHDVWLSHPDGRGAVRVTKNGTAKEPYRSPTQSDGGLIAAAKGFHVLLLRQNGDVVRRFPAPSLRDGLGTQTTAGANSLAFSPDGTKLAYVLVSLNCANVDCMARGVTGVMDLRGKLLASQKEYTGAFPSWVSDDRILSHGGFNYQNMLWTPSSDAWFNWFDDNDVVGDGNSTDLGDGEVSANGQSYVAVRGYDATTHIATYRVNGDVKTATALPAPSPLCHMSGAARYASPTIDASGATAWWEEPDGVWGGAVSPDCPMPALLIPGATEPDWSAADVAPKKKKKPAKRRRG